MSELEWTGERYIPSISGVIELEHYHRYLLAKRLAAGKRVLDIACGEGYGSNLLADVATSVVGVDISSDAVSHAKKTYSRNNIEFVQGDCAAIPVPDNSVDLVVSFETIEHHDQHDEMMHEIKRVLKEDGVLVISSPDKKEYSDVSEYENEFHVKELYLSEFDQLLRSCFKQIAMFGQRVKYGSLIVPIERNQPSPTIVFDKERGNSEEFYPLYFIAVATNGGTVPMFSSFYATPPESIYDERFADLNAELAKTRKLYNDLHSELLERTNWAVSLSERLTQLEKELGESRTHALSLEQHGLALNAELENIRSALNEVLQSTSWKISRPVRLVGSVVRPLITNTRQGSGRLLRMTYHALPISHYRKLQLKSLCFSWLPALFRHSSAYRNWRLTEGEPTKAFDAGNSTKELPDVSQPLYLNTSSEPVVSVVIPVYGKIGFTYQCLVSVARLTSNIPFEVIVVDDCSPDETTEVLNHVSGVQVVKHEQNMGFIVACNSGAKAARGEYLLFLNNDTEVTPTWMDELRHTFELFPEAGLVGSKLVYPNGKLQEGGGIIWQDGSGWNYGRYQDPAHPEFNYLREVDYCSAASIMIPKKLFDELGGFDSHFRPAYYEDTDLAFRVREAGYRVLYQPLSQVIHHEGITSGTDVGDGVKSFQAANAVKFRNRWTSVLQQHRAPGVDPYLEKERSTAARILVLDHNTPTPDKDAGSVFTSNIIRILQSLGFKVTFIPEDNFLHSGPYTEALQRAGVECLYAPHVTSVKQHLREHGSLYSAVLVFRFLAATRNVRLIRRFCPDTKIIFHPADLHFLRLQRQAQVQHSAELSKQAEATKVRELEVVRSVDLTMVHSTREAEILTNESEHSKVVTLPWILEAEESSVPFHERHDIVFIGGYQHQPNVDAVLFFLREIFPAITRALPDTRFYVAGSNPPEELLRQNSSNVIVTGYVEDLGSLLGRMRLSIAPLRFGAGLKGKIASSMGVGLPCVATPIAVEGMGLTPEQDVLVADSPEDFANAVIRAYEDQELWQRLSDHGSEFIERNYSFENAKQKLSEIITALTIPTPPPGKAPCPNVPDQTALQRRSDADRRSIVS